jgi:uncharacterized protein YegL
LHIGRQTIFTTLLLSACLMGSAALAKDKFVFQSLVPKLDPLPPPKVLRGSVAESTLVTPPPINAFGFAEQGKTYPTTVTYVAPNSVAWLGGLQAGDHIVNGRVKPEKAIFIVQRKGKKYGCVLNANATSVESARQANGAGKALSARTEKSDAQTLSSYGIAMVVDNSASMGTKDCPGGISRWQWCKDHISELYIEDKGVLQQNISIVTFDSNFHSRQNCSPSELQSVFAGGDPTGETNMGPALDEAFLLVRRQLDMGKPAIVSVISDGRPSDVERVKAAIIRETKSLPKPQLLSIVFIEVGTPEHYLQELDKDLVKQGAAADIVKVIPFASASSQGLSKTLAATIPKAVDKTSPLSGAVTANTTNKAKEAVTSHIYTYAPPAPGAAGAQKRPAAPVVSASRPAPVPAPAVKAHPSGTMPEGTAPVAKAQEVDEKAAALRGGANRTYK